MNKNLLLRTIFSLFALVLTSKIFALDPNHFTITRITAPYFIIDANSPATITNAYVGFEVKNNSGITYPNLKFTINSIGTSVSGQNYVIVSPASGIINAGTLAPGETKVCYYYISYPAHTTAQATFNVQLSDNTAGSKSQSFMIYNRASISANAGGVATQAFSNQDLIGGLIMDTVIYTVGNVQNGDENDFQVAVSTQFDPTKITLLSTRILSSAIPGITAGTTDSLYFISGNGTNGATVKILWTFRITATNFTTNLLPCAGATSGSTNYKYALNSSLGNGTPVTVSSSANPLTITKTSDQTVYGVNSVAVFTITINNPGIYPVTIDKVTDEVPAGFSYQDFDASSQVTAANSTAFPSAAAVGNIIFEGGVSSGSNTSYVIPAGGSIVIRYTAMSPSTSASDLLTTARAYIGTTEIGAAQNTVSVSSTLPIQLILFKATAWKNFVKLEWTSAQESNSSHFEIERSTGRGIFDKIGEKNAAGNSFFTRQYFFTDSTAVRGVNYYRLKLIDRDGTSKYSSIISAKITEASNLHVFPIPANNTLTIESSSVTVAKICTATGAIAKSFVLQKGRNQVDISKLQSGMYYLLYAEGEKSLPFIVQHF